MNLETFVSSTNQDAPPEGLELALQALWQQANGHWDAAHKLAQEQDDKRGAWVHAHLHRVEGDERNAGYWYQRADKPHSTATLDDEWKEVAAALLA